MASILELLTSAYDLVYFTAELKKQKNVQFLENRELVYQGRIKTTLETKNTAQRIIQFFGLPSGDTLSIRQLLKSLAGWNPNYSGSRKLLQAVIIFPINLILTLSKLALNIVKLFTEFLPHFLAKSSLGICKNLIDLISDQTQNRFGTSGGGIRLKQKVGTSTKILCALGLVIVGPITAVCHALYFIGCATTSPADTLRSAFSTGDDLMGGGILGKVVGGIFALTSALTTACVYAILFPLAIKLLITQAPTVLPTIANGISQFVGIFSSQAGAAVSTFFMNTLPGFFTAFGATVSSVATPILTTFTLSLSQLGATPILAGLAGVIGIGVGGVITPATAIADKIVEIVPDDPDADNYKGYPLRTDSVTPWPGSINFFDEQPGQDNNIQQLAQLPTNIKYKNE